jgi:hypothetical protein
MAGPFDNFFGGGGAAAGNMFAGNMFGDLLTPEQLAAVRRQSMMQVAAKLLESSGPSTTRRTLGQTLGGALSAGAEAMQSGQTNAVQQMLLKQKLDEAKAEREQNERIRKMIGGGDATIDTINAPVETAGRVGPTVQRAAMPTTAVNPLMAGLTDQQRAILQITPTSKVPDVLAGFQKDASAMSEVTGQPFEVTDATGQPIMVQQTKGGKISTLEGFGPKRDVVLQSLGGRTVAIDKKSLKGGESFDQSMTQSELANLSLAQQRFAREGFDLVDTDQGKMYVSKVPGQPAIPAVGPGGAPLKSASADKPTDGQNIAAGFAQRMELATSIIDSLPPGSQAGAGTRTAEMIPFLGGVVSRAIQSPETQKYEQAAQDWIRAKLRKESGAVIGPQEARDEYATYFPMVGDSPEKIAQKAEARRVATLAMKKSAGPAYEPYVPLAPPPAVPSQPRLGTGTFNITVDY